MMDEAALDVDERFMAGRGGGACGGGGGVQVDEEDEQHPGGVDDIIPALLWRE
jgi:hypothetical protein